MRTLLRAVDPGAAVPWWRRIDPLVVAELAAVVVVVLFYLALKTYALWVHDGDEHIYFAMARAIADGAVPYRDFFFAHPPVHILVPSLVFRVFGFSYSLALWIAPAASLLAGLALWRLVRRFAPPWAGVLAMVLFLFGRTVLQSGAHLTGVNIGLAFLLWGTERVAADRPKLGGALLALSVLTGIYFLPATVGVIACYAFFRPRRSLQAVAAWLLVGLGVAALFEVVTHGRFFDQAIRYHRAKTPEILGSGWPTFAKSKGQELFHNWHLFLGAIVGGLASLVALGAVLDETRAGRRKPEPGRRKSRTSLPKLGAAAAPPGGMGAIAAAMRTVERAAGGEPGEGRGRGGGADFIALLGRARARAIGACGLAPWTALGVASAAWVLGHWIFLATLPIIWRYYWAVVYVGAAVATAMTAVAVWRGMRLLPRLIREHGRGAAVAPVVFAAVVASVYGAAYPYDMKLGRKYHIWGASEEEQAKAEQCSDAGCARSCRNRGNVDGKCKNDTDCDCVYAWVDSPAPWVPRWFDSLVRRIWWGGDVIPDGERHSGIANTLWHESRNAPMEKRYLEAAQAIRERACPEDTIFGDSESAPLLANLSGLRVAGMVFDTNNQRFRTGFIDPEETVTAVRADGVRFVALRSNSWAQQGEVLGDFIRGSFERFWPGPDEEPFGVTVWVWRGPPPCAEPGLD